MYKKNKKITHKFGQQNYEEIFESRCSRYNNEGDEHKNAERVREACRAVPLDRLLIETDAPYLAPVPYRGKINNSILMQETCAVVAQVHRIGSDEMAEITYKNACDLFKI